MRVSRSVLVRPKSFVFGLFTISNIYAIAYALVTGRFIDLGSPRSTGFFFDLIVFSAVFIGAYYFLQYPCFRAISRIRFKIGSCNIDSNITGRIGWICLFTQGLYLVIVLLYDAGRVGRDVEASSVPLSWLWAVLQIDFLSLYYIFSGKRDKLWFSNLFLFAVSNLVRGWTSFILVFTYLYLIHKDPPMRLGLRRLTMYTILFVIVCPTVLLAKFYIRTSYEATDIDDFLSTVIGLPNSTSLFGYAISYTVTRLQQVSLTWFVFEARDQISSAYASGDVVPFWAENLYGNFFYKLIGHSAPLNLGQYATLHLPYSFKFEPGSFNISPGIIGWLGIVSNDLPAFLLFLFLLLILSFALIHLIARRGSAEWRGLSSLMWYMWLVLLLPGWMNQFIAFLHAGAIYLILAALVKATLGRSTR